MEKHFRPSPAKLCGQFSAVAILIALSLLIAATTTTAYGGDRGIVDQELQHAIAALRSNGYNLFSNAIATSNLRYQIPEGESFTFTIFSPSDANVFALDMASEASVYVQNLRYHVVPLRLAVADLLNLSSPGVYLETLLPHYSVLINHSQLSPQDGDSDDVSDEISGDVTADGVRISYPDLYLGSRIAVHGLDGILAPRFEFPDEFSGELGFGIGLEQHMSPNSPQFPPNLVSTARSPPEKSRNSRFRKRGKRHEDHHIHGKRRVHGHRKEDNKEVDNYQIRHGKFSKLNRHSTDDL